MLITPIVNRTGSVPCFQLHNCNFGPLRPSESKLNLLLWVVIRRFLFSFQHNSRIPYTPYSFRVRIRIRVMVGDQDKDQGQGLGLGLGVRDQGQGLGLGLGQCIGYNREDHYQKCDKVSHKFTESYECHAVLICCCQV